jgi:hypothetical protein
MEDEIGGPCRTHGEMRNAHNILVRKLERRRSFVRPRWENNIKMDLKGTEW